MSQFRISEEGFKKFRKRLLTRLLPIVTIGVIIVLVINLSGPGSDMTTVFIVVPFVLLFLGFSFYRSMKKQKQLLMSYSVTISDHEITREQQNTPSLSINFMEIKEIIKTEKGGFLIKGLTRADVIAIPQWINDAAGLEQQLEALGPIRTRTKDPFYVKYQWVLSFLVLAMMLTVYAATNKILVGICGALLTGFWIWAMYEMWTSKNIPESTKRKMWVMLIVLASIVYVMYLKLTAVS